MHETVSCCLVAVYIYLPAADYEICITLFQSHSCRQRILCKENTHDDWNSCCLQCVVCIKWSPNRDTTSVCVVHLHNNSPFF